VHLAKSSLILSALEMDTARVLAQPPQQRDEEPCGKSHTYPQRQAQLVENCRKRGKSIRPGSDSSQSKAHGNSSDISIIPFTGHIYQLLARRTNEQTSLCCYQRQKLISRLTVNLTMIPKAVTATMCSWTEMLRGDQSDSKKLSLPGVTHLAYFLS